MAHLFQQQKTVLTFSALIDDLHELIRQFPDKRTGNNSFYTMEDDALAVNWCELTTTDDKGKELYHNAFVSNYAIDAGNVEAMVQAGRTHWKVENENNNTLKTKGYHLIHNFGHGKQHLSTTLPTLNLLAFLLHTVLDTMDKKYRLIRATLLSRKMFFQHIQALTSYLCFDSFDALLDFMMQGGSSPFWTQADDESWPSDLLRTTARSGTA